MKKKGPGRLLWGKKKGGKTTTKGNLAGAVVKGTVWLVHDRCDGSTLVRVTRGSIQVRDFVKKKTRTLKQGGRYVARPKR